MEDSSIRITTILAAPGEPQNTTVRSIANQYIHAFTFQDMSLWLTDGFSGGAGGDWGK